MRFLNVKRQIFMQRTPNLSPTKFRCRSLALFFAASMATASLLRPHHHRQHQQHVVVMRHGDRLDNVDPSWLSTAPRPWDPPLAEAGQDRAINVAKLLPAQLGFPIHRVVVSPFRRCVDTALGLMAGLSAQDEDPGMATGNGSIDPSKVKVSIEYGLGELFNHRAIRHPPPSPTNHADWGFNVPEIEALIPADALDNTVMPVFSELPQWEETEPRARERYLHTIRSLADRYPSENLLLITHGEAVKVTVSTHLEDAAKFKIRMDYCGYAQLRRQVVRDGDPFEASEFELLASHGQTGIHCLPMTSPL
ncbi:hypothetical protein BT93_L4268 [Corymbia citriodora subsp. variegata]|uniref:Phosphoglycerate mutase family protein n=1 Tax=Corymbia citriodora subsp. variegata TaxID=360336 RepID=A0A8T0CYW7_CORYI|nr:hypothetical protein BT93_L4268 [Corymbia citriodora subsp. variegata]